MRDVDRRTSAAHLFDMAANLKIDLPQSMVDFIDAQVASGEFVDADDYLRDVIREHQRAVEALQVAIDHGDQSGISPFSVEETFARARERHLSRAA